MSRSVGASKLMRARRPVSCVGAAIPVLAIVLHTTASAQDFQLGDVKVKMQGVATVGTSIRTSDRDLAIIPSGNGRLVGVPGVAVGGRNQDDGNLNFGKGDHVSSVAKAVVSIDASLGNFGVRLQGKTWYDAALANHNMPWGNLPNGFAAGQPLSDNGLIRDARFHSFSLLDAYVYGKASLGGTQVSGRLGNQMIGWGSPTSIAGGLFTSINAIDLNALYRPGMQPEEVGVRMPAAFAKVDLTKSFSIEGFYQLATTRNHALGCGTFFSAADYVAPGCDKVIIGGVAGNDRAALATGAFVSRAPTPDSESTQFGIGTNYTFESIGTRAGLYFANVDSRSLSPSAIKTTRAGAPVIPGNADGRNAKYFTEYAPDVRVISANFATRLNATTISGEATIKQNAPVNLNAGDLLNAFASATAASLLRGDATATPLGGIYHGYDTFTLGHYQLGVSQGLPGIFGARSLLVGGEVAFKQVYDLPDVNVRRYGRPDVYGLGPVGGVCTGPAYQCTTAGFVTENAWGYRLSLAAIYQNAFMPGLMLRPSIGITHDVDGWSGDNVMSEGRIVMNLGLRAEYNQKFFATLQWNPALAEGRYDNLSDRQVVSIASGIKF